MKDVVKMSVRWGMFGILMIGILPLHAEPLPEIILNACLIECCKFGSWRAVENVVLYDSPGSELSVTTVRSGEIVRVDTGEEHVNPLRIDVTHNTSRFKTGDVLYTSRRVIGCGLSYSRNGSDSDPSKDGCLSDFEVEDLAAACRINSVGCWGHMSGTLGRRDIWWIHVLTPDGKSGWTRETGKFTGRESCS